MYVAEAQPFKRTNKGVFNALKNDLMLGGKYFNPASPADFHPASWRQIQPWYVIFGRIPGLHIVPYKSKVSHNYGR